jgi:outer membrane protein insertion porin family
MALMYWLRKHSNKFLWILFWLIFTPRIFAQSNISQFQFKKVGTISIEADGPVDREFLLDLIELTPNVDILTASKIRKSIELIYGTGNFSNVLVDATQAGDRVDLKFVLRTVYRIEFIHLKGQLGVSGKNIRRAMSLRKLEPYTPEKVLKGRESILSVLRQNGYYNARIIPEVLLHRGNRRAEINYNITAGAPAIVRSFDVTGKPYFTKQKILSATKTKVGKRFKQVEFDKDLDRVEAIYDKAGFLEHKIEIAKNELTPQNQVILVLDIESGNQLIFEVTGFKFSDRVLRENIPVWVEHSYNDDTLEEGKRNLIQYLQTKGYYDAKITWSKDVSTKDIRIRYVTDPGPKYGVESIQITGNEHLPRNEILNIMTTKQNGLFGKKPLVTKVFESDIKHILSAYRLRGFLFANITKRNVIRENGQLKIQLEVEEGPQSFVTEIRLKGNHAIKTEDLISNFQQKIGDPISEKKVKTDSNYIIARYSDEGFPKAQLETRPLFSQDKTRAIIEYRLTEGEQIFVDRIVASGNYRTKREVLNESLYFHEDSPFSLRKISESQSKLYSLNIFDRVDIQVPRPDNLQKFQNVYIRLTEAKPYTFSYGFGYQTFDLLHGIFALSNRNWLGTARTWGIQLRGGFKERRALLSYIDPHLFFHRVTNTLNGFAEHRVRPSFSFSRYGGTLQVERVLSKEASSLQIGETPGPLKSVFLRYGFEDIRTTSGVPGTDPRDRRFLPIHISSVAAGFVRDARNNPIDPTSGTFLTTDLQYAAHFLGSATDFVKSFNQAQYYLPFGSRVIATSFRLGLAKGFRDTIELPISQQFFAGGGRTIRGFDLDEARTDENGNPVGGNMSLIVNLEYRFPLFGSLGGVLFFDYGNVFPLIEDFEFSELRKSAGLGLRYKTPIGPVAFDWGYKLDRKFAPFRESAYELFFSVGHAF